MFPQDFGLFAQGGPKPAMTDVIAAALARRGPPRHPSTSSSFAFGGQLVVREQNGKTTVIALVQPDAGNQTLCDAIEGNLWSGWSTLGQGPRSSFRRLHGALMVETEMRCHPYNFVQHMADEGDLAGQIDRVFEHFGKRGTDFLWLVGPSTAAGTSDLLEAKGFVPLEEITGMAADLAPFGDGAEPIVDGVTLTEATVEMVDDLHSLIASRWGVPEAEVAKAHELYRLFRFGYPDARGRFYVALEGGKAIGKCLLHGGAGVAGIHGVATLPPARGRGIASALTRLALRQAYRDGYRVAVLHSSPMAVSTYARLGFDAVTSFEIYGRPGSFHA